MPAAAQGLRPDVAISIGDGKLVKPYTDDFGFSVDAAAHLNYVHGVFLADAGIGLALLNDSRKAYYRGGAAMVISEPMLEVPVGLGLYLKAGGGAVFIIGIEITLLHSSAAYYEISPHIDLISGNRRGNKNGFFLKGMFYSGSGQKYAPRYIGVGYKAMFAAQKGARRHKPAKGADAEGK